MSQEFLIEDMAYNISKKEPIKKTRGKMKQPTKEKIKEENVRLKKVVMEICKLINFDCSEEIKELGIFDKINN